MRRRIVIVGANSAGISAAVEARKTDVHSEIILISEEKYLPYSRCGLPYVLSGEINSFLDLVLFPPSYYTMMKLDLKTETVVKTIIPGKRIVQVENRKGDKEKIKYDRLLLTTGATSCMPQIEGIDKDGVLSLRGIDDGNEIQRAMSKAESAVVIGAGYIGVELAHALVKKKHSNNIN